MQIPNELIDQFSKGNGAIFVGAGLSIGAGLPGWATLIDKLLVELEDCPPNSSYLDIAQYYVIRYGRHCLISRLREELDTFDVQPTSVHHALAQLRITPVFTTNYDNLIEKAFIGNGIRFDPVISTVDASFWTTDRIQLVKFHGDIHQPESVVLTSEDYERYYPEHPALTRLLSTTLQTRTLLLLGYSATDMDFRLLLTQVQSEAGAYARNAYAVMFDAQALVVQDMERRGIRVINFTNIAAPDRNQVLTSWLNDLQEKVNEKQSTNVREVLKKALPPEPYKFLHWFGEEDIAIFHGREYEINRLTNLAETQRVTVLYGESGTGKTSLLRAGIIPTLRQKGYLVCYFRPLTDPFKEAEDALTAIFGSPANPTASLKQIISNGLPNDKTLVVMLDQFEEFFIRQGTQTRKEFEKELKSILDATDINVHFLFSLRSDYLDRLDEFEDVLGSDPLRFRIRLHNLGPAAASAAIMEPAKDFGIHLDQNLLEKLISDLGQGWIAPPQLQIVCYSLWKDWMDRGRPSEGLRLERYRELGSTEEILANYLIRVLEDLGDPKILKECSITLQPETAQNVARAILKSMITSEKTKIAVSSKEITQSELVLSLKLDPDEINLILRYLQNRRIVRHVPDSHYYELVHEVMISQIWSWVTEDERRILDIQDILQRAVTDYKRFQTLLSPEYLNLVQENINHLSFNSDELELLLTSAINYNYPFLAWVGLMDTDHTIAILEKLILTGRKVLYPQIALALGYTNSSKAVRYLDELCREDHRETQRAAAASMSKLNISSVVPPLFRALMREQNLQRAAPFLEALENLNNDDAIAMLMLVAWRHPDLGVRRRATNATIKLKKSDGFALLEKQLASRDDLISEISVKALEELIEDNPIETIDFFNRCDLKIKTRIVKGLSNNKNRNILKLLSLALNDQDQQLRLEAISTLCRFEIDEEITQLLYKATKDSAAELRNAALGDLVKGREEKFFDLLVEATKDESPAVRMTAVSALSRIKTPKAIDTLVLLLDDNEYKIRSLLVNQLSTIQDDYVVTALELASSSSSQVRKITEAILSNRKTIQTLESIKASMISPDIEKRLNVVPVIASMDLDLIKEHQLLDKLEYMLTREADKDAQETIRAAINSIKIGLGEKHLIESLSSHQIGRIISAITKLGEIQTPRSTEALLSCLQSKNKGVLSATFTALAKARTPEIVRAVSDQVATNNFLRVFIFGSLRKKIDPGLFHFYIEVVQKQSAEIREQALVQLRGSLGGIDALAIDTLMASLEDESASVRSEAVITLRSYIKKIGNDSRLDILNRMLESDSIEIKKEIIKTLQPCKNPRFVDALIAVVNNAGLTLRRQAFLALDGINDPRVENFCLNALNDPNQDIQSQAIVYLRTFNSPAVVDALIGVLNNKENRPRLRKHAAESLGSIKDPRSLDVLIETLNDDAPKVTISVVIALRRFPDPRCIEPLLNVLKKGTDEIQLESLRTLSSFQDARVVDAFKEAANSPSTEIRTLADKYLSKIERQRQKGQLN